MGKILLDYIFPVTAITPAPAASTAFLKQVLCLCDRKDSGVTYGVIVECTDGADVDAVASAAAAPEIKELFAAGMAKVYVLPTASLDIDTYLQAATVSFWTILITSDFSDGNVASLDVGDFEGVIGVASADDTTFLPAQAAIENRCAFFMDGTSKAKNMFYAFGKLLSANEWKSQQYVSMPEDNGVTTLGDGQSLFDDRISFVMTDSEYGKRLSFFGAGGHAIVEPYIKQNVIVDMQSKALVYLSANQPAFTKTQAALLEDELRHVIDNYENDGLIETGGTVEVELSDSDAFVATADITVPEPSSLWIIQGTLTET